MRPPVLFSPLTGSDGYNPFLTTGEILGSGLDSDPARAPGQTLRHRQEALVSHSCLALGFPWLGLDLLTVARVPRLSARTVLMSQAGSAWVEPRAAEEIRRPSDFLQALYGPQPRLLFMAPAFIANFLLVPQGGSPHVLLPLQHPVTGPHPGWKEANMYNVVFSSVEQVPVASHFFSGWASGRMLGGLQGNVFSTSTVKSRE